ncbi:hypothetical protein H0H92_013220 [Tricholoma furcatifolium]|nr:hypothetical protein H0H92_013220 [Tricholoma furcatifolium]
MSTDSESPPPEEIAQPTSTSNFGAFASHIAQTFGGGSSKRRLPGGSAFAGASGSSRDPKTRRKMEQSKGNMSSGAWDSQKEAKREEKELVDHHIVEYLRSEVGDPFDDTKIHALA